MNYAVLYHGRSIRYEWLKHHLKNFKKNHFTALERNVAKDSIILTEDPVVALECKQDGASDYGNIEAYPHGE